jgi:hypothetical protein
MSNPWLVPQSGLQRQRFDQKSGVTVKFTESQLSKRFERGHDSQAIVSRHHWAYDPGRPPRNA